MNIVILFLSAVVGVPLFFLPTIIAKENNHPQFGPIFLSVVGTAFLAILLQGVSMFVFPPITENGITTPDMVGQLLTWTAILVAVFGWAGCTIWSLIKKA